MDWDTLFFEIGSWNINYRREHIGITQGSPLLNIEPEFYEVRHDYIKLSRI